MMRVLSPEEGPAGVAGEGPEVEAGPGGGPAHAARPLHTTSGNTT